MYFVSRRTRVTLTNEIYVHTNDVLAKERRQNVNENVLVYAFKKSLINKNQVTGNLVVSLGEKDVACMIIFQRKKGNEIEMRGYGCSFTMAGA